jgi:hypothetical protein
LPDRLDPDSARVLARLRALLARGLSISASARQLRRPRRTMQDWADRHALPHRRRTLSREKDRAIRQLLDRGQRPRAIMRAVGCGFGAVQRRRDEATLARFRSLQGDSPLPTSPWRCPGCGLLLNIDLCLVDGSRRPRSRPRRRQAERSTGDA